MTTPPHRPPHLPLPAVLPALRRDVLVLGPAETAFALFTAHLGAWWPLDRHGALGAEASVAFEGTRIVERLGTQAEVWGTVQVWDPPRTVAFSWHPGQEATSSTELTVTFEPRGDTTLVSLVHEGWERTAEPAAARHDYEQGWPEVLALFAVRVAAPGAGNAHVPAVVSVMLTVPDAPAAVDWYTSALGARTLWSIGPVAGLEVGSAPFFVSQAEGRWNTPVQLGGTSTRVEVFVDDPDALVRRAVEHGADSEGDAVRDHDAPWGTHRQGAFRDPFGHWWLVGDRSPLAG